MPADFKVIVPPYMKEIVAEISRARAPQPGRQPALGRRACAPASPTTRACSRTRCAARSVIGEDEVVPRVSDLPYVVPTIAGKVEFETVEDGREEQIIDKLIQGAVVAVFNRYFNLGDLEDVVNRFKSGIAAEVGDMMPSDDLREAREADRRPRSGRREGRRRGSPRRDRRAPSSSSSKGCT